MISSTSAGSAAARRAGVRVAGEQRRRHDVDAGVGGLRRQDRRGEQLERVAVVELADRVGVLLRQPRGDRARPALRRARRAHAVDTSHRERHGGSLGRPALASAIMWRIETRRELDVAELDSGRAAARRRSQVDDGPPPAVGPAAGSTSSIAVAPGSPRCWRRRDRSSCVGYAQLATGQRRRRSSSSSSPRASGRRSRTARSRAAALRRCVARRGAEAAAR